ncbi:hypothetical protein K493DRAFT_390697 [Basidiobolus meristosporus CBS 931.73]|uniref:Globin-like protein n=1 Tax=Basidiobolus meristosporus CBS 931.73 TaxID=1314790 RepID=A0A1Y1YRW1_9FUNG|nr:hypothetical protein K493DRAFT_390697 [Basidiobolus meristosporus CBS 931.73]|eukprot:ORY00770.1 hypothetical protein K493DRAFT_390697 [Basidiobolus meristosporus CBS 931.73]
MTIRPTTQPVLDEASLALVLSSFHEYNLADTCINNYFRNLNTQTMLSMQAKFLAHALGGAKLNHKIMSMNHRHLKLQDHHFDAVMNNLHKALKDHDLTEAEINHVLIAAEGTRDSMLGRTTRRIVSSDFD